jgi:hypothetical protein
VSLRAEIHDALDEVSPAAPHLELRVTRLILEQGREPRVVTRRAGRTVWTRRFRGAGALVAAALLLVLIGGLILEGRMLRDMSIPPPAINQAQLKKLETRSLQFPVVKAGDPCPVSPLTDVSAHGGIPLAFGTGPVYSTPLLIDTSTIWGTWMSLSLEVDNTMVSGLVLVRAKDLQTGESVVFARYPFSQVGDPGRGIAAGPVLGSQVVQQETVQLHPAVVIDTSRVYAGTRKGDWPIYKSSMGVPKAATGCLGLQVDGVLIDGTTFTELVVLNAS